MISFIQLKMYRKFFELKIARGQNIEEGVKIPEVVMLKGIRLIDRKLIPN